MSDLPPLPSRTHFPGWADIPYYTADQMQAYARAAVAAERERAAKVCELESVVLQTRDMTRGALYCAAAIRREPT